MAEQQETPDAKQSQTNNIKNKSIIRSACMKTTMLAFAYAYADSSDPRIRKVDKLLNKL